MRSSGGKKAHSTAGLGFVGREGWKVDGEEMHIPGGGNSKSPGLEPCSHTHQHTGQSGRGQARTRLDRQAQV